MTKVIAEVYVELQDGTYTALGTLDYLLEEPYDSVDDTLVFSKVKQDPRAGYNVASGMLELMGNFIQLSNLKRAGVRLLQKEHMTSYHGNTTT